jgi:hypothetical protein
MSKTMSLRLTSEQLAAVEKWRRRFNQRSTSATLQLLLEEKLREEEYSAITFGDSAPGRQAYVAGTGLAVWEVMMVARAYENDVRMTAEHLEIPERLIHAALNYASDFPDEIGAELAENEDIDFEALRRILPDLQLTVVPRTSDSHPGTETAP